MFRIAVVVGVICCLLICQPAPAQQNQDIELLKKEIELLKKEVELLKKENEQLKSENEKLKSGAKKDGDDKTDKPTATVDGVTYVVDKATRNGPKVTLQITATNNKADCMIHPNQVEAVDTEGNTYKTVQFDVRKEQLRLTLREGVKTKFDIVVTNVPNKVTELSRVDIQLQRINLMDPAKEPIKLKNVKIEK